MYVRGAGPHFGVNRRIKQKIVAPVAPQSTFVAGSLCPPRRCPVITDIFHCSSSTSNMLRHRLRFKKQRAAYLVATYDSASNHSFESDLVMNWLNRFTKLVFKIFVHQKQLWSQVPSLPIEFNRTCDHS